MRYPPKRKRTKAQSYRRTADTLFRQVIRERDGTCRMGPVGCDGPLEVAHGFPRRRLSVRWDPDNAFLLCAFVHHRWFDSEGLERWVWMQHELGPERYDALAARQLDNFDGDYARVIQELRELRQEVVG